MPHDYETDPRPLAECLKEWQMALNGGKVYGARKIAERELRVDSRTYDGWMTGRTPAGSHERLIRRVMTMTCP